MALFLNCVKLHRDLLHVKANAPGPGEGYLDLKGGFSHMALHH